MKGLAPMIIGISGKMGTGKTVVASYLADLCNGRRVSFAGELRQEVVEQFKVPMRYLTDRDIKEAPIIPCGFQFISPRELMQWWGEERRRVDKNYWIDKLLGRHDDDDALVLVDDVRYQNEAAAIRQAGGLLVRLEPYPEWPINPGAYHRSETDLDSWTDWDYKAYPPFAGLGELARYIKERFEL